MRARLFVVLMLAGASLALGLAGQTMASALSSPLPPPVVRDLVPQVRNLTPMVVDLRPKQSGASLTVDTDVLFAFNSAALSPDAQAVLGQVVSHLRGARAGTVTVTGYTDSIGTPQYNLGLSLRRAQAVQAYLRAQVGNPQLRYRAVGKGEADPVAPNTLPDGQDNPNGRRQNRRVVITTGR
jgi:outer membrane protein OmpA-like peptidoglycan-associated protein